MSFPRAIILAAGEGTRLRPLTADRPKPMLLVGDRPALAWIIAWLRAAGIEDVAINLHHQPDAITDYLGNGAAYGVRLTYSYEERLLGSAGAMRRLGRFCDRRCVIVYGDVLTTLDLSRVLAFHAQHQGLATLVVYTVPNPTECGIVALDTDGRLRRFVEKPAPSAVFSSLANAGVYVLEPGIAEWIPQRPRLCDFGQHVFPAMLGAGQPLWGVPLAPNEYLIDFGTPAAYARAQDEWPAAHAATEHRGSPKVLATRRAQSR